VQQPGSQQLLESEVNHTWAEQQEPQLRQQQQQHDPQQPWPACQERQQKPQHPWPGSQSRQQELLPQEECTLPPPDLPPPIPFGSFTQPLPAALHPPSAMLGDGQPSMPSEAGQQKGAPASCNGPEQHAAGASRAAAASGAAVLLSPPLQQNEQLQVEDAAAPGAEQPPSRPPAVQSQQQSQQEEEAGVSASPPEQVLDLAPESSPPFSWRLSPLPPSVAAEMAAAGTYTPSYPVHPPAAGDPAVLSSGGRGGGAARAKPAWDSVPPTPAGLLDFSETAADCLPPPGDACGDTPATAGPPEVERGQQTQQQGPGERWAAEQQCVAETPAGASLAQPSGRWQQEAGGGAVQRQQQQDGREADQTPPPPPPPQQQQQQQQPCFERPPAGAAAQRRMPAAASSPSLLPAPDRAAGAAGLHASQAAEAPAPAPAASPSCAALEGPVLGTQLRLPTPALLAVASPDGQYAAVLLGSYGRYEPTEVVVLQLGSNGGVHGRGCLGGLAQQQQRQQQQQQEGSEQAAAAGLPPGGVRVLASVPVRLCSEQPGWQLNSNSLQLAVDARWAPPQRDCEGSQLHSTLGHPNNKPWGGCLGLHPLCALCFIINRKHK
jgi:hypothetical protein